MRILECWQCGNIMGVWRSNEDDYFHKHLGETRTQSNICCRKCYLKEKQAEEPIMPLSFH